MKPARTQQRCFLGLVWCARAVRCVSQRRGIHIWSLYRSEIPIDDLERMRFLFTFTPENRHHAHGVLTPMQSKRSTKMNVMRDTNGYEATVFWTPVACLPLPDQTEAA